MFANKASARDALPEPVSRGKPKFSVLCEKLPAMPLVDAKGASLPCFPLRLRADITSDDVFQCPTVDLVRACGPGLLLFPDHESQESCFHLSASGRGIHPSASQQSIFLSSEPPQGLSFVCPFTHCHHLRALCSS